VNSDRYGSKIQRLLELLDDIFYEDPSAQVIIVVQWADLKMRIAAALEEFGVRCLVLDGKICAYKHAVRLFKGDTAQSEPGGQVDAPRILVFSLEDTVSGAKFYSSKSYNFAAPASGGVSSGLCVFRGTGDWKRPESRADSQSARLAFHDEGYHTRAWSLTRLPSWSRRPQMLQTSRVGVTRREQKQPKRKKMPQQKLRN